MAEAERTCPNCGRPVTATARICIGCGRPLPHAPVVPLESTVPGPISDPEPPLVAPPGVDAMAPLPLPPPAPEPEPKRGRRRFRDARDRLLAAPPPPASPAATTATGADPAPPFTLEAPPHAGTTQPLPPLPPPGAVPPEPPTVSPPPPGAAPAYGAASPQPPGMMAAPSAGAAVPPAPGVVPPPPLGRPGVTQPPPAGPPGVVPPPPVGPPVMTQPPPGMVPPPTGPPGMPYPPPMGPSGLPPAGTAPYPPGPPYRPPVALPPPPPAFPRPDTNIMRALRRSAARSTITAGIAAGLVSAVLVTAASAVVAVLWWGAHLANNCSAQGAVGPGDCHASGANGYLTNLNAVLWQSHGSGEVIGLANGANASVRLPFGLGILLVGSALYFAGRLTVRMLFLRSPRDAALRSLVVAATHTAAMMIIGAAVTARGSGIAIGPDYGFLLLWGLGLGFIASYAGILRRTFPHVPRKALVDRATVSLGPVAPFVSAALAGLVLAFGLSAVAGIIAMATHVDQTADAIRAVVAATTTKPWPDGGLGTFAAIILLVLTIPTWASWVLGYSLVIPTVSSAGFGDLGLTVGDHDAYFWIVVLVPITASLMTGYAAARLRRAGSVEAAVLSGAAAGLLWAVGTWIVVALLDGVAAVGGRAAGGILAGDLGFGPALGNTLGALLLWGLVGGVVGGYIGLATVTRPSRLPFLRRYSPAVVGPPIVFAVILCPACSLQVPVDAAFCSRCGTPQNTEAAEAAAQRAAMLSAGLPPPPGPGRPGPLPPGSLPPGSLPPHAPVAPRPAPPPAGPPSF